MNQVIITTYLVLADTFTNMKKDSHFEENIFTTALEALVKALFRTRLWRGKSPDPDLPMMMTYPPLVLPASHTSFGS